jgi:hypothetical protein
MSRFDTLESEKECKKREQWGGGWRMQDNLNQHVKKTDDIFSIIAGKTPTKTLEQEPIKEYKPKRKQLYYNKEGRVIRPRGMAIKTRRESEQ